VREEMIMEGWDMFCAVSREGESHPLTVGDIVPRLEAAVKRFLFTILFAAFPLPFLSSLLPPFILFCTFIFFSLSPFSDRVISYQLPHEGPFQPIQPRSFQRQGKGSKGHRFISSPNPNLSEGKTSTTSTPQGMATSTRTTAALSRYTHVNRIV